MINWKGKRIMGAQVRFWTTIFILVSTAIVFGSNAVLAGESDDPPPGSYRVLDGKVDPGTYTGWFVYHMACHTCHGEGAVDTGNAPDLRKSLKVLTRLEFTAKVLRSYRILSTPAESHKSETLRESVLDEVLRQQRGEWGRLAMPAWQDEKAMAPHILDLYAYLKARSDEAIGPEPPKYYK